MRTSSKAPKGPVDTAALRERAVGTLTRRMLSAGQLEEKLLAWGATTQQAEEVTAWAGDIGLINDQEYAVALAEHYQRRGYGIYKIKEELHRRRVPREHWDQALAQLEEPDEIIDRFLSQKLRDPEDRKQVKKAADALVRRGFSWSQVSSGLRRFTREWEEDC